MSTQDIDVKTCEDIRARVAASPTEVRERQYLIKKAVDLGCTQYIPDDWEVSLNVGREED